MDRGALKEINESRNSPLKIQKQCLLRQGRNKQNKTALTGLFLVYWIMFVLEQYYFNFISLKTMGAALKYVPLTWTHLIVYATLKLLPESFWGTVDAECIHVLFKDWSFVN